MQFNTDDLLEAGKRLVGIPPSGPPPPAREETVSAAFPRYQSDGDGVPRQKSSRELLEEIQLAEAQERRDQALAAREMQDAVRRQNAHAMDQKRLAAETTQRYCNHRKPNNHTAVAGQRTHQGWVTLLCQYCQKEYKGAWSPSNPEGCPSDLLPPLEMVGGPNT